MSETPYRFEVDPADIQSGIDHAVALIAHFPAYGIDLVELIVTQKGAQVTASGPIPDREEAHLRTRKATAQEVLDGVTR